MQTITAEEARSLSNDNNSEIQERKKELDKALKDCMVKIRNAAKAGSFRVECHCRHDLIDEISCKLRSDFGYLVSSGGYLMSDLSHIKQEIPATMFAFEVTWKQPK